MCAWTAFILLAAIYPYWGVYLVPFLILTVFMNVRENNLCLFLEWICEKDKSVKVEFNIANFGFPRYIFSAFCQPMNGDAVFMLFGDLLELCQIDGVNLILRQIHVQFNELQA